MDIWDNEKVSVEDLGSNFYLKESDIGSKTRAEASHTKLAELNNYVKVDTVSGDLGMSLFEKYGAIVFTEVPTTLDDIVGWNKELRAKGIATLLTQTLGVYGYHFNDFGDNHKVHDPDGERVNNFIVINVSKVEDKEDSSKNHLIVRLHEDKRHTYHDESYVTFREVGGTTELNNSEPMKIEVVDGFSFKIKCDISKFSDYVSGGIVEDVKVPLPHKFVSLERAISHPLETAKDGMFMIYDFAFFDRSGQLHLAF